MEVEQVIMGRRSVRSYETKPVPEEILAKILKAGAMAPSARDARPCRYIVIESRQKILEIAE
ncbi:MAG: nitroreductase family protein, partial [Candidatus Bilamarchaeaceae archaeon]